MDEPESNDLFHIDVLNLINSKHFQHGLRHGDFQRYRKYCRDKIRRIRRTLTINRKSKHNFQKLILTPQLITDSRYLTIHLFCAERCWAHSNEIKNNEKQNPKRQYYVTRRLKKFCVYARAFHELVENTNCDLSTKWEAKAYYHWAMSTLYLSLKKWDESLNFVLQSKKAYEGILQVCRSDMKPAYQNRIDELSVSEKYCTYSLKGSENSEELKKIYSSINSCEFDAQLSGALSEARQNTEACVEIDWLDRKYYVQARKVKEFLLNLREKDRRLSESSVNQSFDSKLEFFDKYLLDCKEALQELSDLIHSEKKPSYFDERFTSQRDLEEIQTYITFIKLSLSSERNEVIFQDLYSKYLILKKPESSTDKSSTKRADSVRPEHFIRILDQLIQNTTEMSGLSGVSSDDFKRRVYSRSLDVYNACRCYFGSLLMESEIRYKDGVCLLYKSLDYFNSAKLVDLDECANSEFDNNLIKIFEEKALSLKIHLDICSLSNSTATNECVEKKSIFDQLYAKVFDERVIGGKLIEIPCPMILIPCDPIIKDTALEKIHWPDIYCDVEPQETEQIQNSNIQDDGKQSQGFASYVKSWIWGS